jgi:hypothetical protein
MNRRSFLARLTGGLAAAVATATLDPDQLLWVPGQRQYFDLGGVQPFRPLVDAAGAPDPLYAGFLKKLAEDFARQVGPQFAHERLAQSLGISDRGLLVTTRGEVPMRVDAPLRARRLAGFRTPTDLPTVALDLGHDGVAIAMDQATGVLVRVVQYHQAGAGTLTDFEVLGREIRGNDHRLMANRGYPGRA